MKHFIELAERILDHKASLSEVDVLNDHEFEVFMRVLSYSEGQRKEAK